MNSEFAFQDLCSVKDVIAAITELENKLLTDTGLNLNQSFALCCLAKGPKTAGALAAQLKISGPSLSRILRKLIALGLISRDSTLPDARNRVMFLSPTGQLKAVELQKREQGMFPWCVGFSPPENIDIS